MSQHEIVESTLEYELTHDGVDDVYAAEGLTTKSYSPRQLAVRRYFKHKGALISTVLLAIMVLFVVLAPITARYGVNEAIFKAEAGRPNQYLSPRSEAWFGTNDFQPFVRGELLEFDPEAAALMRAIWGN